METQTIKVFNLLFYRFEVHCTTEHGCPNWSHRHLICIWMWSMFYFILIPDRSIYQWLRVVNQIILGWSVENGVKTVTKMWFCGSGVGADGTHKKLKNSYHCRGSEYLVLSAPSPGAKGHRLEHIWQCPRAAGLGGQLVCWEYLTIVVKHSRVC